MARKQLSKLEKKVDDAEITLNTAIFRCHGVVDAQYARDLAQRNLAEETIKQREGWYNVVRT